LSGGQRQRALIAAALSADPAVLLADEPTTALDPAARERVLATLAELRGAGRALVLVSHDLGLVSKIADRVLVLDGGRVVEAGETARVLAAPEHAVTRALLAAIPAAPGASPPGPPPGARPVLSLRGVTLLRGGEPILRGASLGLRAGEALGLVGPSGAGKSSLALAALGLLPLAAGGIRLGEDAWSGVQEWRRRPLRPRIQWVPQDAMGSFPPGRTVGRILGEALFGTRGDRAREHTPRARRAARVAELLASVGLDPALASRRPAGLSGGQRQRVAIARALATDPEVLICDESVSALDTISRAAVLDLLARLRRERGLALLFISHDLDVVRSFCDRVLELRDGRLCDA
ncbi:ABC transporter ATP-binding protein, partial [Leucobacter sp. M11]|uniref:ABC transporter ATP-binding protein n=1 Tax=Leucobacter sp. M11 TaxID=2993565 RepID=UPI002D7FC110